jgi:hypothetical protein
MPALVIGYSFIVWLWIGVFVAFGAGFVSCTELRWIRCEETQWNRFVELVERKRRERAEDARTA